MYLGVDYYPEHWPEELMPHDLSRMDEMGGNMIRIGEFAWHLIEHTEGSFDFSFFDKVIETAKNQGFKIMFGTPTATFPAWLAQKHPEILSQDAAGHRRVFGGRRQYCFNAPEYLAYSLRMVKKLVTYYAQEESIVVWQIDNELGHEGSDQCFCTYCHQAFQLFLKEKFNGNITELNNRYGTIFWGQTYNSFSEIPMPSPTITTHNPALRLDWSRFRSCSINEFARQHNQLIRECKGEHQQVTHNLFGGFFNVAWDQNQLAEYLDFVSYDNYPVWGGLKAPIPPAQIAMTLDYVRGLKQRNFWIVEQLMGAQGHNQIGYLPRPNQAKLWAYQAMARGCDNLLFFRWRGMTRGAEQFCLGIVDANNQLGRKYQEAQQFMHDIVQYEPLITQQIKSDVAILYDFDNIQSWLIQQQSESFDFMQELMRLYTPFHDFNVMTDVLCVDKDFSHYKIVVLPPQQIIDAQLAQRLDDYVAQGGILLAGYRCGIKDRDNNLYFGQPAPVGLTHVFGITVSESESLGYDIEAPIVSPVNSSNSRVTVWRDMVTPQDKTEILYRYDDAFYNEQACVTRNAYGSGFAYYLGAGLNHETLGEIVRGVLQQTQIEYTTTDQGVEKITRGSNGETVWLNHNSYSVVTDELDFQAFEVRWMD